MDRLLFQYPGLLRHISNSYRTYVAVPRIFGRISNLNSWTWLDIGLASQTLDFVWELQFNVKGNEIWEVKGLVYIYLKRYSKYNMSEVDMVYYVKSAFIYIAVYSSYPLSVTVFLLKL